MWWTIAAAWGCDGPDYAERVVGWSADGAQVLIRAERTDPGPAPSPADAYLTLYLADLATGRTTRSWTILSVGEKDDAALRGARWKAAEVELAAARIVVDSAQKPLAAPWTFAGHAGLKVVYDGCVDDGMVYTLRGPGVEVPVKRTGSCAGELSLVAFEAWVAPEGRGLLIHAKTACVGEYAPLWVPAARF